MSVETGTIIGAGHSDERTPNNSVAGTDSDPNSGVGDQGRTDGDFQPFESAAEPTIKGFESYNPGTGDFEPISSAAGTGSIFGESTGRRGRRKGSKNKPIDPASLSPNLGELDFAAILISAHGMLAALTGISELAMEDKDGRKEAEELANAFKAALKFHSGGMSPQKLAYINLGLKLTEVYGTRAMAYRMRVTDERSKRPKPTPINQPKQTAPAAPSPASTGTPAAQGTGTFGAISPEQLWSQPAEE